MLTLDVLKDLRKKALSGADQTAFRDPLCQTVAAGPTPESDLALKVAENIIKGLYGKLDRARTELVVAMALAGVSHPMLQVRKPSFYRLAELARVLSGKPCYSEWMGSDVLAACRRALSDPGTDVDERGMPLQTKGTLTVADKALDVLNGYGKETRSHAMFYGVLAGLDRANGFMAVQALEPGYGRKLLDKLLDTMDRLLSCEDPMPLAALTPEAYPNYLTEFLCLVASTEYRHVPLEPLMDLVRTLPRRKRYIWHMVEVVRQDEYAHVVDMLWAHIAREMEDGHFAAELKHGLRTQLADGHLPGDRVPPELREVILKKLG